MKQETRPPAVCPYCETVVRHIPAGVSKKSGKAYNEFWGCKNMDCDYTWSPPKEAGNEDIPVIEEKDTTNGTDRIVSVLTNIWEKLDEILGALKKE